MKFTNKALLLVGATIVGLSSVVMGNVNGNESLNFLRRQLGDRCKDDGTNCEIKFLKAKYDSHEDMCTLKYKFVGDGSDETFKITFREYYGAEIEVKDDKVKCILRNYDGSEDGDHDGLRENLEFDTQEDIPAKYDDRETTATVEKWKKHEDLVLIIYEPYKECSFDHAENCDVVFEKTKYIPEEALCWVQYFLVDKHTQCANISDERNRMLAPPGADTYRVNVQGKKQRRRLEDSDSDDTHRYKPNGIIEEKDGKVTCTIEDYDGSTPGDGDGLPEDLKFFEKWVQKAKYNGEKSGGRVEEWEKDDDFVLVIYEPYNDDHCDYDDHSDESEDASPDDGHDPERDDGHGDDGPAGDMNY